MPSPDKLTEALGDLSRLLLSEETLESTLQRIIAFTAEAIPGCDWAGITQIRDGKPATSQWTDDVVKEVDGHQYETGQGPCLASIETRQMQSVDSLGQEERWPLFRDRAVGTVHSVLALPLLVDHSIGSLNLYSAKPHAFTDVDRSFLALLAAQAAVAVANAVTFYDRVELAEQLRTALDSRGVIDQAKGILMDRHRIDADQAFEMLRRASQDLNRKLRDVAQALVDSVSQRPEKGLRP
jgi:GAF domain-containing protein